MGQRTERKCWAEPCDLNFCCSRTIWLPQPHTAPAIPQRRAGSEWSEIGCCQPNARTSPVGSLVPARRHIWPNSYRSSAGASRVMWSDRRCGCISGSRWACETSRNCSPSAGSRSVTRRSALGWTGLVRWSRVPRPSPTNLTAPFQELGPPANPEQFNVEFLVLFLVA